MESVGTLSEIDEFVNMIISYDIRKYLQEIFL